MEELAKQLLKMLIEASEHLDYVGYGDSWERSIAQTTKLRERIEETIEDGKKRLKIR